MKNTTTKRIQPVYGSVSLEWFKKVIKKKALNWENDRLKWQSIGQKKKGKTFDEKGERREDVMIFYCSCWQ